MKKIYAFLFFAFLFSSCNGQNQQVGIDASKVKVIKIKNKVDCNFRNYKSGEIIIKEKKLIEDIINAFKYLTPLKEDVVTNANNGVFEIDFYEGDINHYYIINYTIYDGVIISNYNNGERFKNNRLEVEVQKHFLN